VLVDMRARLEASERPRRIFEVTVEAAKQARLVGPKRVLGPTPLYDAVATMDTLTLVRSAVRGLLKVAGPELEAELRAVIESGDDYASSAKPRVDWDDEEARKSLIDSRAKDAYSCSALLEGRELMSEVREAAELLAYLDKAGIDPRVKVQPPVAPGGLFPKDRSSIDLAAGALTCPAGSTVAISFAKAGDGTACFGDACSNCLLRQSCKTAAAGRTVSISPHEELLRAQRERFAGPSFATDYRATRPKVERILAHLVLRRHGGRQAQGRRRLQPPGGVEEPRPPRRARALLDA
jgi:hypothetical protein